MTLSSDVALGLLDSVTQIVSDASAAITSLRPDDLAVRTKADASPVTAADEAAQEVIVSGLMRLLPGVTIVSEEAPRNTSPLASAFILVDPLDGTREFIAGRDEYTVNIAIVSDGAPLLGVVAAPAQGTIWRGVAGRGAERLRLAPGAPLADARDRQPIHTRPWQVNDIVAVISRSHFEAASAAFLERLGAHRRIVCGSALKFCRVAEGAANLYPRLAPISEWDIAAGHALVAAAGGAVLTPEGGRLDYGRVEQDFHVPAFVAWGRATPIQVD